jgi:hypothetical protein
VAVTLPKSDLRAQVIAAAVFVVFAVGIILFARSLRTVGDEALAGEPEETPRQPAPPRRGPLTPMSATSARDLQSALLQVFGNNARGMPSVVYADYDRHPDRLHLALPLDDADLRAPGATTRALGRMRDVLETFYAGDMQWTWVLVTGTAPAHDQNGTLGESTVIRAQFSRDRLRRLDWRHAKPDDLKAAAEQYWVNLDLGR